MKKIICVVSTMMVSAIVVFGLCSFTLQTKVKDEVCTEVSCQGKHCNYSVGCSGPGFAPTQHEEVNKLSICKYCNHHKKYHK
jgi:hypothetical protein